jgi:hypothetical protein
LLTGARHEHTKDQPLVGEVIRYSANCNCQQVQGGERNAGPCCEELHDQQVAGDRDHAGNQVELQETICEAAKLARPSHVIAESEALMPCEIVKHRERDSHSGRPKFVQTAEPRQ